MGKRKASRSRQEKQADPRLGWALVVNSIVAIGEIVLSVQTGSTALLADGFHNADDVAALFLTLLNQRLRGRNPGIERTFGFRQINKLTGFAKGSIFLMSSILVLFKTIQTIFDPKQVDEITVLGVGTIAFIVNFSAAFILRTLQKNVNVRTFTNALAYDALGSLIVMISAILAITLNMPFFDFVASFLIAFYMAWTGWILVYKGRKLFFRTAPKNFDYNAFNQAIRSLPYVTSVDDIHIWHLTSNEHHLTCRVTLNTNDIRVCASILRDIGRICRSEFGIQHSTAQPLFTWSALDSTAEFLQTGSWWIGAGLQFLHRERIGRVLAMQGA